MIFLVLPHFRLSFHATAVYHASVQGVVYEYQRQQKYLESLGAMKHRNRWCRHYRSCTQSQLGFSRVCQPELCTDPLRPGPSPQATVLSLPQATQLLHLLARPIILCVALDEALS